MYQLEPIRLLGLSESQRVLVPATETVTCVPVVSITNLGVASIQLWIRLPGTWQISDLIAFCDPARVLASGVDCTIHVGSTPRNLRRNHVSCLEVMAFAATQLLAGLGLIEVPLQGDVSKSWHDVLRTARKPKTDVALRLPSLEYIETYTLFHLNYSEAEEGVDAEGLRHLVESNGAGVRALLTKDVNWRLKKADVIQRKLRDSACSTRESIHWYVAPQGAVKIYSRSLETNRLVSMVLAAFEIELLLGMRYFLEKINFSLNAVRYETTSPSVLARVHRQNIERLDSFYSLAGCTKDTTAERLERLKKSFGILQLSRTTAEKIQALSQLVSAHFEERQQRSQTLLTVLFGVFGAGQLTAAFFFWYYSTPIPITIWTIPTTSEPAEFFVRLLGVIILVTLTVMIAMGAILYSWGTRKARPMSPRKGTES
jgi:hypothetical protein